MRFEAKKVHGNFKNIPFTLAYEHQVWMCHQLYSSRNKNNFLYKGDEVKGECTIDFSTSEFYDDFISALNLQPMSPLLLLKCRHLMIEGVKYKEGSLVPRLSLSAHKLYTRDL